LKPRSFFLRKEKVHSPIFKAKKIQKTIRKRQLRPLVKNRFRRKISQRHYPSTPEYRKADIDDLISSPLSEPYDFQSFSLTDFPSSSTYGSMICPMNLIYSDSEDYTPKKSKRLHSLFEFNLSSKLNTCLEKGSVFQGITAEDEEITRHLKDLNL